MFRHLASAGAVALIAFSAAAPADVSPETIQSLSAPDSVETRIGTLEFRDGVPSAETVDTVALAGADRNLRNPQLTLFKNCIKNGRF